MAPTRERSVPYDRQVFLNCPFDDEYRPLLRTTVSTIHACGIMARIALENTGSESVRLDGLVLMIGECGLGIHDPSRVRLTLGSRTFRAESSAFSAAPRHVRSQRIDRADSHRRHASQEDAATVVHASLGNHAAELLQPLLSAQKVHDPRR